MISSIGLHVLPPPQTDAGDIAVVIPAYNAGATLEDVLSKTLLSIPNRQVIVVDDGSTDNTAAIAVRNAVQLARHGQNRGKGAALKSGFAIALKMPQIRAVITMDADGQHAPEHLIEFVRDFRASPVDLIIGCRQLRWPPMPLFRLMSNRLTSAMVSWRVGVNIPDTLSGYRLHSRRLLEQIKLGTNGYEMEPELLLKSVNAGMKLRFISISTIYAGEKSYIRGGRDMWRFLKMWMSRMK